MRTGDWLEVYWRPALGWALVSLLLFTLALLAWLMPYDARHIVHAIGGGTTVGRSVEIEGRMQLVGFFFGCPVAILAAWLISQQP